MLQSVRTSGNAIPFVVWDELIGKFNLSITESGVLLYLCRRTFGYGRHGGDLISIGQVAAALNISRASAKRAMSRLEYVALLERIQRLEPDRKEHGTTHIRVTLEAGEVSSP